MPRAPRWADASPTSSGATKTQASSNNPSRRSRPTKPPPASTRMVATPDSASAANASFSESLGPSGRNVAPRPRSSAMRRCAAASSALLTNSVAGASPSRIFASTGVMTSGSNTIRRGRRCTRTPRGVSCGSSSTTVPMPVSTASTRPRSRWTIARLRAHDIHLLSPLESAMAPSIDCAHFALTHGSFVVIRLMNGRASSSAPAWNMSSAGTPASMSFRAPPPAIGLGSATA